jgi:hypothetical protein
MNLGAMSIMTDIKKRDMRVEEDMKQVQCIHGAMINY